MKEKGRGWRPEVRDRLNGLIAEAGGEVAVFDFDNTCIFGDIGELYSHYLIDEMKYRYDLEVFWEQVDRRDGREELRRVTEAAMVLPKGEREGRREYERYLAEMGALYGRRYARAGKRDCYEWAVRLHAGIGEEEMRAWSREAFERELRREVEVERREATVGEVRIHRGIRLLKEIGELIEELKGAGMEVWIVSATNEWTVQMAGAFLGVEEARILGNRVAVRGGVLTGETEGPVLFREGKVARIEEAIGRRPSLVAGDAVTDLEMLEMASRMALVIDRGDKKLREVGEAKGWAFQPQEELMWSEVGGGVVEVVGS